MANENHIITLDKIR